MNTTFRNLKRVLAVVLAIVPAVAFSQAPSAESESLFKKMNRHGVLNTVEIAANIGTTGLGLELASPITKWTKLRVGVDYMPKFSIPMNFGIDSYVNGNVSDGFGKIQNIMDKMTGLSIDKVIGMESKPSLTTFRLLVDVYPFRNKHWHFTAGFFVGGRSAGNSINKMDEMPSLLVLNMYDRLYREATAEDFIDKVLDNPIIDGVYLDPEVAEKIQEKFLAYGELAMHIGDHKDGTPYMMMPDKDGTVSAKAYVNRFRPYVGFGYGGALSKDGKWQASFDAGVQIWGGVPKVTTHDGTVLNDLVNLKGKVDRYMNLIKAFPVYPTIDFRISYRF